MITQAKLAEFHNTTDRSVRRWSTEEKHRKTVQLEADVTPLEWQLVGEIAQLCHLYNANNWLKSLMLSAGPCHIIVCFYDEPVTICEPSKRLSAKLSNTAEMQLIKMQLEKLVYGGGK